MQVLHQPSLDSVVLYDAQQHHWLYFQNPVEILTATTAAEVSPLLETLQQQVEQQRLYAAGFVSYEAAPAFDAGLVVQAEDTFPCAWFGLYPDPQRVLLPTPAPTEVALDWHPSIARQRYQEAIARIKQYIAQGDTYQVNYSFRLRSHLRSQHSFFLIDAWNYFLQCVRSQSGLYSAFVNLSDWAIASASPELFFQWQAPTVTCRPMKGTAARGLTVETDRQQAIALQRSEKNRAENLMIVDMIRNDLGRIARIGSVRVPRLFELEQYPTLWQMTSPVQCETDASFAALFAALFPCASITGAPKLRTMQIIAELEDSPRRIYTGTIGFLTPQRTAQFNVAIRTVLIDKQQHTAEYGVGGGIVWDSVETSEFEECCTKARILTQPLPEFDLLETLLWTPEAGYFLLELHLQRLLESAAFFGFAGDRCSRPRLESAVRRELEAIASSLPPSSHKIRLRVTAQGQIHLEAKPLDLTVQTQPLRVAIAPTPIHSANVFLYHKTTYRTLYQQARQSCPGYDDVLLWNERGEITESCIANVVIECDGQWYTPPLHCGLLAGTLRQWLLQQGKVQERVIDRKALTPGSRIFLVNSVRQIQAAVVEGTEIRDEG